MKISAAPSTQTRTQVIRLVVLLVFLAGVLYWRFGPAEAPSGGDPIRRRSRAVRCRLRRRYRPVVRRRGSKEDAGEGNDQRDARAR